MQQQPTFNFGLDNFFFIYRTLSMRQKTKNYQNQGSTDKKFDFFPQSISHIPRWVHLVQKTQAKNSHAWAPLIDKEKNRENSRKASALSLALSLLAAKSSYYFHSLTIVHSQDVS